MGTCCAAGEIRAENNASLNVDKSDGIKLRVEEPVAEQTTRPQENNNIDAETLKEEEATFARNSVELRSSKDLVNVPPVRTPTRKWPHSCRPSATPTRHPRLLREH